MPPRKKKGGGCVERLSGNWNYLRIFWTFKQMTFFNPVYLTIILSFQKWENVHFIIFRMKNFPILNSFINKT